MHPSDEEYDSIWDIVSSLSSLKKLFVMIHSCQTNDSWTPEMQQKITTPIKRVQQQSLNSFDLIFDIYNTWFPDDCYLKISYNRLEWETFLFELEYFSPAFNGLHPRCRVVGMNGFLRHHMVRDDMPTQTQLINWINWFSCNAAYGDDPYPEGYDHNEEGESAAATRHELEQSSEARKGMKEEARRELDSLSEEYIIANDPEKWDVARIQRAVDLMDCEPWIWRWKYPEQPSWIKDGTL
jgi:hypothetical protein